MLREIRYLGSDFSLDAVDHQRAVVHARGLVQAFLEEEPRAGGDGVRDRPIGHIERPSLRVAIYDHIPEEVSSQQVERLRRPARLDAQPGQLPSPITLVN